MKKWITPQQARRHLQTGTGEGIRIAIIDSGVERAHPDLKGLNLDDDVAVLCEGPRLVVKQGHGLDVYGHGTAVAAVIKKIAPKARVGSFRVLGADSNSKTSIILRAAREAMDRGYHILNCSFGCGVESHVLSYKQWVDEAYQRGIHVVAACNNMDVTSQEWPAYFPSVISVNMAKTASETKFYYYHRTMVEFAARGVDVTLPWAGGTKKKVSGSSFAAPRVAALLARLLSKCPEIPPLQAKAVFHQLASRWTPRIAASNVQDPDEN